MSKVKVVSFVPKAINGIQKGTEAGALETAINVVTRCKLLSNFSKGYQTGQTKGSWHWKKKNSIGPHLDGPDLSVQAKDSQTIVGSAGDHVIYLELGTRLMDAQPVLRPAVDIETNGASASNAVAKAIKDSVERTVR